MSRLLAVFGVFALLGTLFVMSASWSHANWDAVAQCESNGNWASDGYHKGGLQFLQSTWDWTHQQYTGRSDLVGVNPASTSRDTQIMTAEALRVNEGIGHWPVCGQYFSGHVAETTPETTPEVASTMTPVFTG